MFGVRDDAVELTEQTDHVSTATAGRVVFCVSGLHNGTFEQKLQTHYNRLGAAKAADQAFQRAISSTSLVAPQAPRSYFLAVTAFEAAQPGESELHGHPEGLRTGG